MYNIIERGKVAKYRKFMCYVCDCLYEASDRECSTLTHVTKNQDGSEKTKIEVECRCPECNSFNFKDITREVNGGDDVASDEQV